MPEYTVTITPRQKSGGIEVTIAIPGRPVLFDRINKPSHVLDISPELAQQLQSDGYDVVPVKAPKIKAAAADKE